MSLPADLKYTSEHEWVAVDGDVARIGITDYAADKLGDVVFVDLPKVGTAAAVGRVVGEIESTKSVGELYAPVDGEVVEVNDALSDDPSLVNSDPYGAGWMIAVRFSELPALLTADEYAALTAE
ncbi:glycine cleavage system protein GcvH [Protaetiibacter sp. SSC-01]|uniref:glycine cleavage system protein GcvH n=1 Tax=Protaetiibacter sp. SSC-01 TaxID=2759943 RepID=UPI0016574B64|nr:glycine cleavage system protein GcvH [Protaetiibacter sp. SSC-01]QNO36803.1 glycine cleavage system protein GcvH [Protaetiibacter sp. SSC-01]